MKPMPPLYEYEDGQFIGLFREWTKVLSQALNSKFVLLLKFDAIKYFEKLKISFNFYKKYLFHSITWILGSDSLGTAVKGDEYNGLIGKLQKHVSLMMIIINF